MTVSDFSDYATIVSSISTTGIAIWVYYWTRHSDKVNQRRQSRNEMQTYNLTVLQDDKLLKLEAERHPFGDIGVDGARKLYLYFLWFNVCDNILKAADSGLLDKDHADVSLNNNAQISYIDRDFINQHVFTRGYGQRLIDEMNARWKAYERKK